MVTPNTLNGDPMPATTTCTLHGSPVIRGDRMIAGFWGAGMHILEYTG